MEFKESMKKLKKWFPIVMKYGIFIMALKTLILVIFRCPYILPFLACDMCPVVDCPSKYYRKPFVAFIVGYMIVFRKDYCSKVCPFGTLNDLIYRVRRKISKKPLKLSHESKLILEFLKYVVFLFAILALLYGNPRYYIPIHTSELMASIKLIYLTAGNAYFARLYIIIGALLLGILIPRFWCRYICPLGTGIQLTKKGIKLTKQQKQKTCQKCAMCEKND